MQKLLFFSFCCFYQYSYTEIIFYQNKKFFMNNSQESVNHFQKNDYRTIEQTMEKLSGGTRRLAAQLTTSASFESLWNVLTDYDRLNLYIPNLLSSQKIYQKENISCFESRKFKNRGSENRNCQSGKEKTCRCSSQYLPS